MWPVLALRTRQRSEPTAGPVHVLQTTRSPTKIERTHNAPEIFCAAPRPTATSKPNPSPTTSPPSPSLLSFLPSMASILPHFLLLLSLLTLSLSTQTPTSTAPTLIQKTCNTTTFYDFCVSSLQSDPGSPKADVRGLSTIAVHLAISNATNTSSFAAALAHSSADPSLRAVLRSCSAKYSNAREALQWSLDALSTESYDYAFVHVSAAADYPNVCRVLFRQHPRLTYPVEMARRAEVFDQLCTIALEIISLLG